MQRRSRSGGLTDDLGGSGDLGGEAARLEMCLDSTPGSLPGDLSIGVGQQPIGAANDLDTTPVVPDAIVPHLVAHLTKYTKKRDDALVFTGVKGGPLRRSGFNKLTRWTPVVEALGVPNLHFHDLRHTGNKLAADMGVSLRNLMARMGHDNERAALRYQHRSSSADRAIADGLNALVQADQKRDGDDDDGAAGSLVPVA